MSLHVPMNKLLQKLEERKQAGNHRMLSIGGELKDFFSNDYLGLAKNRELFRLIHEVHEAQHGNLNGSTGSRLLSGNNVFFKETEERLADIFDAEKALLFNSGYNANVSILSSVPQKGDTILYDELIHASLKEGARLSFARRFSFRHNDLQDLEHKLRKAEGDSFVVVESVYSMDGDFSPLKAISELCDKYGANLILDEAHSTGIWGKGGNGIACDLGLEDKIFARIYTFGKAMGIHGACIAGSATLIDFLINFARPFIYTTALPPHGVASVIAVFSYLQQHEELPRLLKERIGFFKKTSGEFGKVKMRLIESESAIQVLKVPGNNEARKLAEHVASGGYDVRAILSPTVREGEERLRICVHVYNSEEDIYNLVKCINDFL